MWRVVDIERVIVHSGRKRVFFLLPNLTFYSFNFILSVSSSRVFFRHSLTTLSSPSSAEFILLFLPKLLITIVSLFDSEGRGTNK